MLSVQPLTMYFTGRIKNKLKIGVKYIFSEKKLKKLIKVHYTGNTLFADCPPRRSLQF